MGVYPSAIALEMELAGVGAGWTNVWSDVAEYSPVQFRYGILGNTIEDRVAAPGDLTFALKNDQLNSARLLGYYSPGNANCRVGFATGINVRLKITYSGTTYVKFHGRISSIQPLPGKNSDRATLVVVNDWMDEADRAKLKRVPIQVNQRSDQIFSTLVTAMTRQPVSTTVGVGRDTYVFALDGSPEEGLGVLDEFQRLALSEVGYIYIRGNTGNGGELVYESRTDRAGKNVNVATFNETMVGLDVIIDRNDIISRLQVTTHPRRIDTANQVLFTLRDPNVSTDTALSLGPGETKTIVCPFTDPDNRTNRIGGTSLVNPVATTDYLMNAAADGSGTDLTASLSIVATFGATAGFLTLTNTSASATGFITFLQLRGLGIYDQQTVIAEASSATDDQQALTYDMPYQADPDVGAGAASYFLNLLNSQIVNVSGIDLIANYTDAQMIQALAREPGDRIGIAETVSGLTTATGFFIQSVEGTIERGGLLTMHWGLAPASRQAFWLLGIAGASEMGQTTYVGF